MAVPTNQLADEFAEIKKRFSHSPYIDIAATAGDPPESYEIEYHVKGASKDDDGKPVIVDSHRVKISLPFGFPHFPPNCKPLTVIFHPDFDPDAVCIGDFWKNSPSLVDLIIHIGRLISYQAYSVDDVFNAEALQWARANADQLPLDEADLASQAPPPGEEDLVLSLEERDEEQEAGEEVAVEESLELEIGEPEREEQKAAIRPAAEAAGPGPEEPGPSPAGKTAPPAPEEIPAPPPEEKTPKEEKPPAGETEESKEKPPMIKPPKRAAVKKAGKGVKRIAILGLVVLLVCAGAVAALFFLDMKGYEKASLLWQKVPDLVDQGKFKEADTRLAAIKNNLDGVRLFRQSEKQVLLNKIDTLRSSRSFQLGLQGKVLLDGKYISVAEQQNIKAVEKLLAKGRSLAEAGKHLDAVQAYEQAAGKARELGELAPLSVSEIERLSLRSRVGGHGREGQAALARGEWAKAVASFEAAMELLAGKTGEEWSALRNELATDIALARFSAETEEADRLFGDKKWQQALPRFDTALKIASSAPSLAGRIPEVKGRRGIAAFHAVYDQGLAQLEEGKWGEAVRNLQESKTRLARAKAAGAARTITEKTIDRKILTAAVQSREKAAEAYLAGEEYAEAVRILQELVVIIQNSPFAAEDEFSASVAEAEKNIGKNRLLYEVQEKIIYLTRNYEDIFKAHFSSVQRSRLSDPAITFEEREGSRLIFKMNCKEEVRGETFNLEMFYAYDKKTGKWSAVRE